MKREDMKELMRINSIVVVVFVVVAVDIVFVYVFMSDMCDDHCSRNTLGRVTTISEKLKCQKLLNFQ